VVHGIKLKCRIYHWSHVSDFRDVTRRERLVQYFTPINISHIAFGFSILPEFNHHITTKFNEQIALLNFHRSKVWYERSKNVKATLVNATTMAAGCDTIERVRSIARREVSRPFHSIENWQLSNRFIRGVVATRVHLYASNGANWS